MTEQFNVYLHYHDDDSKEAVKLAEMLEAKGVRARLNDWKVKIMLRQNLSEYFNLEELRSICFELNIKHENLPVTLDAMARELVSMCERRGFINDLIGICKKECPLVNWDFKAGYFPQEVEEILKKVQAVLILIGKGREKLDLLKKYLHSPDNKNIEVIPVLLPGATKLPMDLSTILEVTKNPIVKIRESFENSLPHILLLIKKSCIPGALEVSKKLVTEANKNKPRKTPPQKVDVLGIAILKSRLQSLADMVAGESSQEAILASETHRYDALTMLVPLTVSLRWHRGYAAGLERLLNIPKPEVKLKDFQCSEALPPCPIAQGILSAETCTDGQVLIRLDGQDAVIVESASQNDQQDIIKTVNQYGRLGVPKSVGQTLLERIRDIPIRSQLKNTDEIAAALNRNREALLPLIARLGMPGSDWLLPSEENFPPIGDSLLINDPLSPDNHFFPPLPPR